MFCFFVVCPGLGFEKAPNKLFFCFTEHFEAKNVRSSHLFTPCAEFFPVSKQAWHFVTEPLGVTRYFTSLCFAFVNDVPVSLKSTSFFSTSSRLYILPDFNSQRQNQAVNVSRLACCCVMEGCSTG